MRNLIQTSFVFNKILFENKIYGVNYDELAIYSKMHKNKNNPIVS